MKNDLKRELFQAKRHMNSKGVPIAKHHAFRTIGFTKATLTTVLLLPIIADVLLGWQLDNILAIWQEIFSFWIEKMDFVGEVTNAPTTLLFSYPAFPLPPFEAALPSADSVYIHGIVAFAFFVFSFFLPEKLMPITYLLRTCLIIHFSAVIYFLISPDYFPYQLSDHISGGLGLGIYILFLIPPILGMVYYIFDFGIWRKILLTAIMLGYFILFLPMQYLLHALILHHFSIIFLPLLYLMFGLLLDILMCIAIYSYGMSWKKL